MATFINIAPVTEDAFAQALTALTAGENVTQKTATAYSAEFGNGIVGTLTGSGFTYDGDRITDGTIAGYSITQSGSPLYEAFRLDASVETVLDLADDPAAAQRYFTRDDDTLIANQFADNDDVLNGNAGDDFIAAGPGDDQVRGGRGADLIFLQDGDDQGWGGRGDDLLDGGVGNDILTGGRGADTFAFKTGYGQDTVTDFDAVGCRHDIVQFLLGDFANVDAVLDAAEQVGGDVVISLPAAASTGAPGSEPGTPDRLTLLNVDKADLSAENILLV